MLGDEKQNNNFIQQAQQFIQNIQQNFQNQINQNLPQNVPGSNSEQSAEPADGAAQPGNFKSKAYVLLEYNIYIFRCNWRSKYIPTSRPSCSKSVPEFPKSIPSTSIKQ